MTPMETHHEQNARHPSLVKSSNHWNIPTRKRKFQKKIFKEQRETLPIKEKTSMKGSLFESIHNEVNASSKKVGTDAFDFYKRRNLRGKGAWNKKLRFTDLRSRQGNQVVQFGWTPFLCCTWQWLSANQLINQLSPSSHLQHVLNANN